jgi:hypothetical protein
MRRKYIICVAIMIMTVLVNGCGSKNETPEALTGDLGEIIDTLYEKADLSDDFREATEYFATYEITEDMKMSILGTDEIDYLEGVVSMPQMSSVAYQCVLLRIEEGNVALVKQLLQENADLDKWICVSAETMLIESRGNVVFFAMGEKDTVYALNSAFQNL